MQAEYLLANLAVILGLGIGAQWVAWRLRIPGILLLLLVGFFAGPVAQQLAIHHMLPEGFFLDPDALFGRKLIGPLVSLAVGVILYEGGLTLELREIREVGPVIRNLVSVGAVVTWLLCAASARWILGMTGGLALLLGAILVVTGPTVIGPLLRQVRPQGPVGSALKWEGIVIDPIGATLAVLVFEVVRGSNTPWGTVVGFAETAIYGGGLGFLGAGLLIFALKRHLIPDMLENACSLAVVVAIFAGANLLHHEAGLLAATVMGIVLANQKQVTVHHIIHFKENLRVLLLAVLFVVLAARVDLDTLLQALNWRVLGFVLTLIFVVRPTMVWISTHGSSLSLNEKIFLSWMAPRGIVAAAVASEFSLRLVESGVPEAAQLGAVTFVVIISTVAIYGLTAGPLAYRLGLAQPTPQGVLILGAHEWAREMALALQRLSIPVLLVDANRGHVSDARLAGLPAEHANVLSDFVDNELDLGGIGRLLALTPNAEVNMLAAQRFSEEFGKREVYSLQYPKSGTSERHDVAHSGARTLFSTSATFDYLAERFAKGDVVKRSRLTTEFTFKDFERYYGQEALPLFMIDSEGRLSIFATENRPSPEAGTTLLSLVTPGATESARISTTSVRARPQPSTRIADAQPRPDPKPAAASPQADPPADETPEGEAAEETPAEA